MLVISMLLTTNKIRRLRPEDRRGAISVLAALLAVVVLAMVAFAVDTGYILSNKQELQRTADAAAMAACWEYGQKLSQGVPPAEAVAAGRAAAAQYAGSNEVANLETEIDQNSGNSTSGDLVFGQIADLYDPNAVVNTASLKDFNAVKIRIRRDETLNGEAPFFFGKIFGLTGQGLNAEATAGYYRNIKGVRAPAGGGNIDVLPYALDWNTWAALLAGNAADQWRWNADTETITAGSDGVLEVNLFPQGTGSPGNRGTVDIGSSNNSTADITRQILNGITPEDLAYHGGSLEFNEDGELDLNGVVINQGWTITGKQFQGVFFESPSIVSPPGYIQVLTNNPNWINFSSLPKQHVRTWSLTGDGNGGAGYVVADAFAPHLNTYSATIEAAANGECWTCLINTAPVDMY